ncbi:hypothetical protein FACS1894219_03000 [Clostridia bacterium]|nr:hypothetical protein FACS1894219_03000 [Clostridia bacterium]
MSAIAEPVRLDEIMRLLFDVSKPMLVTMLNSLFEKDFDPDFVEIRKESAKLVKDNLKVLEGDLFLRVTDSDKPYYFHLEFQTNPDKTMAIRVLQYDFTKATKDQWLSDEGKIILYMPQSLVIHIEESDTIPESYDTVIVFADGERKEYKIPILKYWLLRDQDLIDKKLYPLLPLQVYMLRSKLDKLARNGTKEARLAAILEAKDVVKRVAEEAVSLRDSGELPDEDFRKVIDMAGNLFDHLNNRYDKEHNLTTEVHDMLWSVNDPINLEHRVNEIKLEGIVEGERKGKNENAISIAKIMLANGEPVDKIIRYTKLSLEQITKLKSQK